MRLPGLAALALFIFLAGAGQRSYAGSGVIANIDAENANLPNYTFHADVAVAMHHFPWLHFHLAGDGLYQRGDRYGLHFTQMPRFASQIHDIDLSMLDPSLWPKDYRYVVAGSDGADTIFNLQALRDPTLAKAQVALNDQGADWVDATYTDGMHIHMNVSSSDAGGYLLPSKLGVTIDYPHMPLSANATFSSYQFAAVATR